MNAYEEEIQRRRVENRRFLQSLRIPELRQELAESLNAESINAKNQVEKSNRKTTKRPRTSIATPSRKSARLLGKKPKYSEIEDDLDTEDVGTFSPKTPKPPSEKRENVFGAIPGIAVGTQYETRLAASHDGIHRPTVAGIHASPLFGCYSVALSGGYEDDVDSGDSFVYTGEGGRDLKGTKANPKNLRTALQSKDQVLEKGNLALTINVKNNIPVRVLRGYKLNSKFAPLHGYRYDGLYVPVKYYLATGKSGFAVYKFVFKRLEDQAPAPWD